MFTALPSAAVLLLDAADILAFFPCDLLLLGTSFILYCLFKMHISLLTSFSLDLFPVFTLTQIEFSRSKAWIFFSI